MNVIQSHFTFFLQYFFIVLHYFLIASAKHTKQKQIATKQYLEKLQYIRYVNEKNKFPKKSNRIKFRKTNWRHKYI